MNPLHLRSTVLLAAFLLMAVGTSVSCSHKASHQKEEQAAGVAATEGKISYDLAFTAVLPCKDCEGIRTTLQLSTRDNKYKLKEEFLGSDVSPAIVLGNFNTERGFEEDDDATLYVLNDESPELQQVYFLRATGKDNELLKLNSYRQKMAETVVLKKTQP